MMSTAVARTQRVVHVRRGTGTVTQTQPQKQQLRVAAYCRVSTDEEEQLTSYNTQIQRYTNLVQERPDWTLVKIFADAAVIIGLS